MSVALATGAAFEAICIVVRAIWPACLPTGVSDILTTVIGTGITVALVADYAPARKMLAASIVAGAFIVLSTTGIAIVVFYFVHFPYRDKLTLFGEAYPVLLSLSTICGALFGRRAAALNHREIHAISP
jgi:hypothetical protein